MSTIAFDTHAYVKKLKAVGFTEQQAEVHAETFTEIIENRIATKHDLKELEMRLTNSTRRYCRRRHCCCSHPGQTALIAGNSPINNPISAP